MFPKGMKIGGFPHKHNENPSPPGPYDKYIFFVTLLILLVLSWKYLSI
jgi:hypothetical protein